MTDTAAAAERREMISAESGRAALKDSFGRKLTYLRVSVTERCNLRCRYCVPEDCAAGTPNAGAPCGQLGLEDLFSIVRAFVSLGVRKVRVTGGEPLLRRGVTEFIRRVAALPGVSEVALTTNGILLPRMAGELAAAGLARVNVSIDSLRCRGYREITGGGALSAALKAVRAAKAAGLTPVKVNTVLIKGFNDGEFDDFVAFSHEQGVEVRFIELMPIGTGIPWAGSRALSAGEMLAAHPELVPVPSADPASTARVYAVPGTRARIGFISPVSCDFCAACDRLRLSSRGRLRLCLHDSREYDLSPAPGASEGEAFAALRGRILAAVRHKPRRHRLEDGVYVHTDMKNIGG